jgi:peptidoglycan-associated lipoprotein
MKKETRMRPIPFTVVMAALAASLSVSACASKAKPLPTTPDGSITAPSAAGPTGPAGPAGPAAPGAAGAAAAYAPGSMEDFVAAAGDRVYFAYDSYELTPEAQAVLDAQAGWLGRYPNVRVIIEGNADERGTREYNLALGARRANSVRDYLQGRGVPAGRMSTVSYGKERPIAAGSDEASHALNRNARTNFQGAVS